MRAVCGEGKWEWSAWRRPGPAVIEGHVQAERGRGPPLLGNDSCGRRSKDTAPVQAPESLRSGAVCSLRRCLEEARRPKCQLARVGRKKRRSADGVGGDISRAKGRDTNSVEQARSEKQKRRPKIAEKKCEVRLKTKAFCSALSSVVNFSSLCFVPPTHPA